jgi:hypothetical protein
MMVWNAPPNGSSNERLRYFARQLLTADDLSQEQEYFRSRMRRHNRFLHGWGVVCGCEVTPTSTDWTVSVGPGYLLGPQGDEIVVDTAFTVDLSLQDLAGNAAMPCADPLDPWCSGVRVVPQLRQTLYLAVAYAETATRPVRVQPVGCGCDDSQCEYSRTRDGYIVRLLTTLPSTYSQMSPPVTGTSCPGPGVRPCPALPTDNWVILASITPRSQTISAADIDNVTNRRYAATFADWWYSCVPGATPSPTPTPTPRPSPSPSPSPGPTSTPTPSPTPPVLGVQSLALEPSVVQPGDTSTGTITLSGPAAGIGTAIGLSSDNPSVAAVPNSVTVPAGATSTQFTASTQAVGVARITATLGASSASGSITVRRTKSPLEKVSVDKTAALEKVTDKVQLEKIRAAEKVSEIARPADFAKAGEAVTGPASQPMASAPALGATARAFIQPDERPPVGNTFLAAPDGTSRG